MITLAVGGKEILDEAIDPTRARVTLSVGTGKMGRGIAGCGDAVYLDAGSVRAAAPRFSGLCGCPTQTTTTTNSDPNHPTYFHANPLPDGDDCSQPDGNGSSKGN